MISYLVRPYVVPDGKVGHDAYRLIVQLEGERVRLSNRNRHDRINRFPAISEAALRNRVANAGPVGANRGFRLWISYLPRETIISSALLGG